MTFNIQFFVYYFIRFFFLLGGKLKVSGECDLSIKTNVNNPNDSCQTYYRKNLPPEVADRPSSLNTPIELSLFVENISLSISVAVFVILIFLVTEKVFCHLWAKLFLFDYVCFIKSIGLLVYYCLLLCFANCLLSAWNDCTG